MNLRQLTYFLQIAELQSISRAASVLHVAQSSLSRQIQLLEHELGVLLFVRSDKGVTLTEAGHALQERSSAVLLQVRQIRDDIGLQSRTPKGELSFGLPPSMYKLLTVPLVCEFRQRYPEVQLLVAEGVSAAMHEAVLTAKLDTAVMSDVEPLSMLRSQLLLREQLFVVGARDAGLDMATEMPVRELAERPLLLTSRPNAMRVIVERALAKHGHRVKPVVQTNSARLLCELAAQGQGFSVLPYCAISAAFATGRVSAAPVTGLSVTWTLVSSRERSQTLAGRKLRELIIEIARRQIAAGVWRGVVALD